MNSEITVVLKSTPLFRAYAALLAALLLFAIAGLLWMPAHFSSEEQGKELGELDIELQKLGLDVSMRKAVLEGGNSVSDIVGKINQEVTQTSLVTGLNKIIAQTKVTIAEQAFREVVEEDGVKRFKQLLHVSGEYKKIRYFLSQVQDKLAGLNVIERIFLTQGKDERGIDARVELITYTVSGK